MRQNSSQYDDVNLSAFSGDGLRWTRMQLDSDALFRDQPYDNENELMASCADEWFRVQPDTPFGGMIRFDYPLDKQVVLENEICNSFGHIMDKSKECDSLNISSETSLMKNNQRIEQNASDDNAKTSDIRREQTQNIASSSVLGDFESSPTSEIFNSNSPNNFDPNLEITKNSNDDAPSRRKKNKVLTLSESRRKLALRADVMNKNLFRALRRQVKWLFDDYLVDNGLSTSRSKRAFRTNLKRYSEHLLADPQHADSQRKGCFQKVLGVFLNSCSAKKIFSSQDADKIDEFNSLLYSYSHQKFYSYLSLPEVQLIVSVVFGEVGVEGFIERHRALHVNRDSYLEHINSILANL